MSTSVLERVVAGERWVRIQEVGALEEVLHRELLPRWPLGHISGGGTTNESGGTADLDGPL